MEPLSSDGNGAAIPDAAVLAGLFGPGFVAAVAVPRLVNETLYPEERTHIARAVAKRQAEFGTARLCAREVLLQLGRQPCSLVPHADRSPRWPDGIVGSISHTAGCCAVVATVAPDVLSCGLDIERNEPLSAELEPMICTPTERLWLDDCDQATRAQFGKLFFSAKEAFYKCQYLTTKTLIDFHDVELAIDLEGGSFRIQRLTHGGPLWDRVGLIRGRFLWISEFIVTAALLTAGVR
ncbi:MAG: 4'-phosphopantetheinyl transferase superfamily protein [Aliidongia sp.]